MPRHRFNPEGRALWPLVWRDTRWPVYVMLAHAGLGLAIDALGIAPIRQGMFWNGASFRVTLSLTLLVLPFVLLASALRGRSLRRVQRRYLTLRSLLGALLCVVFITQESQMHEAFKRQLGRAVPFRWDEALSHASIWLHGGVPAWRWLDPLFHRPAITASLDLAYAIWIPLVVTLGCLVAWLPRRALWRRALGCWGLLWLLCGTVLAQVFSSAGPVYYHHLVAGRDPYAPLLAHLATVNMVMPLEAVVLHQSIWDNLHRTHELWWLHISAFPSMHVALIAFFAVVLFRWWRPAGVMLWSFVPIVLAGSVYLAWHYALDGYVAIVGVLVCWWLSGKLTRCHATFKNTSQ